MTSLRKRSVKAQTCWSKASCYNVECGVETYVWDSPRQKEGVKVWHPGAGAAREVQLCENRRHPLLQERVCTLLAAQY